MASLNRVIKTALVQYAATDTSKDLVAAPAGGVTALDKAAIRVHRIVYLSETAHANGITVAIGALELGIIVNLAANGSWDTGFHEGGLLGPVETALVASSTAGPKGKFIVDYSID